MGDESASRNFGGIALGGIVNSSDSNGNRHANNPPERLYAIFVFISLVGDPECFIADRKL
jgi:hypothetical protein